MKRVLIPYDFSPQARRALALALSGAPFGPEVVIDALHVIDDRLYERVGVEPPSDAALAGYFRADVQRATTPQRRFNDTPTLKVLRGRPATEILSQLGDYGGVMVGGQGHGGLSEKFLGTTAMRIVRESPVSVYVAKKSQSMTTPARVLCAVDTDESSRLALKQAYALCKQCDASLSLMRAVMQLPLYVDWSGFVPFPELPSVTEERERLISFEVDTLGTSFALRHEVQFSAGGIAGDVAHRAMLDRIDTIVVGARTDAALKRLLGSVSESVVQQAPCDVFVVR
jgi:nucleotide-binding universal stress UspA family protein